MKLTWDRLTEVLDYDASTGLFTWRRRAVARPGWNGRHAGKTAGTMHNVHGYRSIIIDNEPHLGHRLAWFYVTGKWPPHQVDHINGVRGDDRFKNLRLATAHENRCNRGKMRRNTSGFKGVRFHKFSGLWHARISSKGREISLGYYHTPQEAHEAYKVGALKHHGEFAKW